MPVSDDENPSTSAGNGSRNATCVAIAAQGAGASVDAVAAFRGERKCYLRSCRLGRTQSAMYSCFHATCDRVVHWECYKALVLKKHNLDYFHPEDSASHVVCTKKHYELSLKVVNDFEGTSIPWMRDGPDILNPTINRSISSSFPLRSNSQNGTFCDTKLTTATPAAALVSGCSLACWPVVLFRNCCLKKTR